MRDPLVTILVFVLLALMLDDVRDCAMGSPQPSLIKDVFGTRKP